MGSNRNPLSKGQIIEATLTCLGRYGVAKTAIVDVARELGVTRQTIHRLFETRSDLLTSVADVLIGRLAAQLTEAFKVYPDLRTALVEGSILSMDLAFHDPILSEIMGKADHVVDQFMFRGSPDVQASMLAVWGPLIDRARASGQLRPGLTNAACVEWIRNVHAMMTLRNDYDESKRRELLTSFLVPALLSPEASSRAVNAMPAGRRRRK